MTQTPNGSGSPSMKSLSWSLPQTASKGTPTVSPVHWRQSARSGDSNVTETQAESAVETKRWTSNNSKLLPAGAAIGVEDAIHTAYPFSSGTIRMIVASDRPGGKSTDAVSMLSAL